MKGHPIAYSRAELAWIDAQAGRPRRDAYADFLARFGRRDVGLTNYVALCKRRGVAAGGDGRFMRGQEPQNKGKPCLPGVGGRHPNARKTQFKKGNLPHNTKYLGHERVSKDGYVEVSIDEPNPHTGYERRYVLKHLHLWQQKNGHLPDGCCLKCLDGNKLNTDPSNWEAIPRAMLPRLNGRWTGLGYDDAPAELKPAIMAIAKIKNKAREKKKGSVTA